MSDAPSTTSIELTSLPPWLVLPLGAVAYYVLAKAGISVFSLQPSNFTVLWLPGGVALVLLAHYGWRAAPFIFAAAVANNIPGMAHPETGRYVIHAGLGALADLAAAALALALLRRALPDGLGSPVDLFRFVGFVALPAMSAGTLALTANNVAGGYLPASGITDFVMMLVLADTLGLLLVYPLYDTWRRGAPGRHCRWRDRTLLIAASLALCLVAFRHEPGAIFLVIPVLVFMLFRCSEQVVLIGLLATVTVVLALASDDLGPFKVGDVGHGRVMLLSFLFTTTIVVLSLLLQERRLGTAGAERDRWRFHAQHDALTGLANRASIESAVQQALDHARGGGPGFCLAIVDIDHFKQVNDSFGHRAGDAVLRELAERLRHGLRAQDRVGRVGGEEFVLLLPGLTLEAAGGVVERLRETMARTPILFEGANLRVAISIGLVDAADHIDAPMDALFAEADRRLYDAKRSGRNRVVAA